MTEDPTDNDREPSPAIKDAELTYPLDEADRPSEAVVRAVASVKNTSVLDLDPLYNVMDPDQLDGVFEGTGETSLLAGSAVTFLFRGCEVTVTQDTVHVSEHTDDDSSDYESFE